MLIGGMSIVSSGNGVYTATYSWNPADAIPTGLYDLSARVSDGTAQSIDPFTNNLDELRVYSKVANNAPTFAAGATAASPSLPRN